MAVEVTGQQVAMPDGGETKVRHKADFFKDFFKEVVVFFVTYNKENDAMIDDSEQAFDQSVGGGAEEGGELLPFTQVVSRGVEYIESSLEIFPPTRGQSTESQWRNAKSKGCLLRRREAQRGPQAKAMPQQ